MCVMSLAHSKGPITENHYYYLPQWGMRKQTWIGTLVLPLTTCLRLIFLLCKLGKILLNLQCCCQNYFGKVA